MSSNRTRYDDCAYNLQMNRSVAPGDYRLSAAFAENCNQCFSSFGPVGSKADVSVVKQPMELQFGKMASVESDLSWRYRTATKCNDNFTPLGKTPVVDKPVCNNKLVSEDTRFTNPLDNYRGMSLTSYMVSPYLPVNPQCNILDSYDLIGLNSRLYAKDNYKTPEQPMVGQCTDLPHSVVKNVKKDLLF